MLLSERGRRAVNQPLRADLDTFYEAMENRYHARDNPDGGFTLCIAENGLMWPELREKFRVIQRENELSDWVPSYTAIRGAPELREVAARFLEAFVVAGDVRLDPERLTVAAGAAAGIEMTALLVGDPGDVVVIPGPAYMAYTPDIGNVAGLERYDLHPNDAPDPSFASRGPAPLFSITIHDLDRAHAELGDRFRMLLLTQPNNPTGQVYTSEQLTAITDWCLARNIHLVVNEIYALSLIDWEHKDLASLQARMPRFESYLGELERRQSPYLHWWYSFSKDFGISGMRLGLFYTNSEPLLKAWGNYGSTSMASNHSQWLLMKVLEDHAWVRSYVTANQARLTESFARVITTLRRHDIAFSPAVGSLFVWFNLAHMLTADTEEAELELWRRVYDETGILLTSPVGQGSAERGWYRMVYSCVSAADLEVAMGRFDGFLSNDGG